jgi:hypothetical protein
MASSSPYGLFPACWLEPGLFADAELRLMALLAQYADPRRGGLAFPGQDTLAERLKRSREWVNRTLNKIAKRLPDRLRITKKGRKNRYWLPDIAALMRDPRPSQDAAPTCDRKASHEHTTNHNKQTLSPDSNVDAGTRDAEAPEKEPNHTQEPERNRDHDAGNQEPRDGEVLLPGSGTGEHQRSSGTGNQRLGGGVSEPETSGPNASIPAWQRRILEREYDRRMRFAHSG